MERQLNVSAPTELVIRPSSGLPSLDIPEVWRYRGLLAFLVWRDLKVRFKQTILGVAWVVLRPLLTVVIYTVVFGHLVKIPSEGLPYPIFVLAGLLPWNLFSSALSSGTSSMRDNGNLISKVYFPRVIIPLASVASASVDALLSLVLVCALMVYYRQVPPALALFTVPALLLLIITIAVGIGLWLSALNVKYRDVGYTVPFILQIWMFLTPVLYPLSLFPEKYRWLVALNPMTGAVEGFRAALFGGPWPVVPLIVATAFGAVLLLTGMFFFRASERSFADTI